MVGSLEGKVFVSHIVLGKSTFFADHGGMQRVCRSKQAGVTYSAVAIVRGEVAVQVRSSLRSVFLRGLDILPIFFELSKNLSL